MGQCITCQFWDAKDGFSENGVGVGICTHPMVCKPTHGPVMQRRMQIDGIYTADEGGMTGDFMTGPRFGCVHHKDEFTGHPIIQKALSDFESKIPK